MAVGIPTLMTRCSGYLDYMNDTNALFLECNKVPITNIKWLIREPYQQGHSWWETTVTETRKKMRWAYEHQAELKVIGKQAAIDAKKCSWNNTAASIIDNIFRIANESNS
jgi:sialic acid synthase SpsE